ncbi:26s proteasome non-atpase regulatory subunit 11 [Anaeramoeba flamelloides]|uniref:26s proteasome non-atpase regulatory subunit 11 n=1 Tax=Anaeramoeba flamelloides TaxID=1746091 RepID=A0ABQ8YGZ0_9EUKA|nr:26s proteasome non-atpase regulatory subunit 11 [Anaeramoeba flamelloides]
MTEQIKMEIEIEKEEKQEDKSEIKKLFDQAEEEIDKNAIELYQKILQTKPKESNDNKIKEESIYLLAALYVKLKQADKIKELLDSLHPFFSEIPKARTAKVVRKLIDAIREVPNTVELQIQVSKEWIERATKEKRSFLRQRLQLRLSGLFLENHDYQPALKTIKALVIEVKKNDDKLQLVETHLLESQIHHKLKNVPKAKGSLTGARTSANSVYCEPSLQAELDMMGGILHTEEKDYKTAFSYFFEAFEGYVSISNDLRGKKRLEKRKRKSAEEYDQKASFTLKYMLMSKIMMGHPEDIQSIINSKAGTRYLTNEVEAMKRVAETYSKRSLIEFNEVVEEYDQELKKDPVVARHMNDLYSLMFEQNLIRLIEPFSRVEISHIAKLIGLPLKKVEAKLSQMILDHKFHGILDQGNGCLIVFDDYEEGELYNNSLKVINNMSSVLESLYEKARSLN